MINLFNTSIESDGTNIWQSLSDFIPQRSQYYGRIPIGINMSMEFDFIWHGRTYDPSPTAYEMFFRIGCTANDIDDPDIQSPCVGGHNCEGQGLRLPSL